MACWVPPSEKDPFPTPLTQSGELDPAIGPLIPIIVNRQAHALNHPTFQPALPSRNHISHPDHRLDFSGLPGEPPHSDIPLNSSDLEAIPLLRIEINNRIGVTLLPTTIPLSKAKTIRPITA